MAQREGSPLSFGGAVHAAATAAAAQEAEEDSGELQALATQASLRQARKEATATKRAAAKAAKAPAGPDEARPGKKQRKEAKYWTAAEELALVKVRLSPQFNTALNVCPPLSPFLFSGHRALPAPPARRGRLRNSTLFGK